ncbi:hypothetical protein EBME_0514 [bacterium endosymbiont of Mortierella elongata FMR23-6]|nr:hypothetical protein EBME_0514 [bacterium endosymbiont of Mortierella elongata FMR23-6]
MRRQIAGSVSPAPSTQLSAAANLLFIQIDRSSRFCAAT